MNSTGKQEEPRSFSYPGTFREYSRQAFGAGAAFAGILGVIVLAVLAFDRLFYGRMRLTWWNLAGLCILLLGFLIIAQLMARSLSRFRIIAEGEGLEVSRTGAGVFVPYLDITGVERVRIPGWWPIRADMRPRARTALKMIRIKRREAPPLVFISGLEGEEDLIETIVRSAGLGGEK